MLYFSWLFFTSCVCVFCSNVGGGLISGVTLAAKALNPSIRVLAAEPKGADDAARSKAEGRIITLPETDTIADGLRAFLGELTWYAFKSFSPSCILVAMESTSVFVNANAYIYKHDE